MAIIRSIRAQAQIYYGGLVLALVGVILVGFNFYERGRRLEELDRGLKGEVVNILPIAMGMPTDGPPPGVEGPRRPPPRREGVEVPPSDYGPREGRRLTRSPNPEHFRRSEVGRETLFRIQRDGMYLISYDDRGNERFRTSNAPEREPRLAAVLAKGDVGRWMGDNREFLHMAPGRGAFVLGTDGSDYLSGLDWLMLKVTLGSLLATGGILVFGWVLMGRALKPIRQITETAQGISEGDSTRRIDTHSIQNELGELGGVLNSTFDRLVKSLQQQIRITADASHELRTPVSVILADCDLALRKDASAERKQETLELCKETALHMKHLIESLTQMARWDARSGVIQKEPCDLKELADQVVKMLNPLATRSEVALSVKGEAPDVSCDPLAIKQTIANLVSNAIHYNQAGGTVEVLIEHSQDEVSLCVEDTGLGISVEDLSQIFERFYRVDKARGIDEGRSGLGLAICKAILDAHGGSLEAHSVLGKGSRFRFSLPR